jgi:hypothetical protein
MQGVGPNQDIKRGQAGLTKSWSRRNSIKGELLMIKDLDKVPEAEC